MHALLICLTIAVATFVARRADGSRLAPVETWLRGGWSPAVLGAISAMIVLVAWGSLRQPAWIHDERAYLLQAELFGTLRWTAPARVLPEFFEQAHVIVTPVLASKYFPGNSLFLVPGVMLGLPGLMPVVLTGLAGLMLFALVRRVAGPWVALLTWAIWSVARDNVFWRASYMSETVTSLTWLVCWWSLLSWRRSRRAKDLVIVGACVGLCAITRPLTGVAFALPVAALVLHDLVRNGGWSRLAPALVAGVAILGVVPLWSARTTGDWRVTPLTAYSRDYMPYDKPGFGLDSTPPARETPPDLTKLNAYFASLHAKHVPSTLPRTAWRRLSAVVSGTFADARFVLLPLAILGLVGMPGGLRFALACAASHVLAYLTYAHGKGWTLYYVELFPVLACLAALGAWRAFALLLAVGRDRAEASDRARGVLALGMTISLALPMVDAIRYVRAYTASMEHVFAGFDRAVASVPERRAIVLVRYRADHDRSFAFITNEPDQQRTRVLTAYDRGADNARLLSAFPDRAAYLYDEATLTLRRLR